MGFQKLIDTTGLSKPGMPGVPWNPQFLTDQGYYLKQGGRLCSKHYYLPHQIYRPSYVLEYLRCLNYQDLASTNSQMFYSLMIKFNTPTDAKTIRDKNTKALDSMAFTSNDLFQEKQNK